jgi:hypothetical protein
MTIEQADTYRERVDLDLDLLEWVVLPPLSRHRIHHLRSLLAELANQLELQIMYIWAFATGCRPALHEVADSSSVTT